MTAHVLSIFFGEKLDNFETVIPALEGIVALVKLPTFSVDDVPDTMRRYCHLSCVILSSSTIHYALAFSRASK
jgi:hypothetical protein